MSVSIATSPESQASARQTAKRSTQRAKIASRRARKCLALLGKLLAKLTDQATSLAAARFPLPQYGREIASQLIEGSPGPVSEETVKECVVASCESIDDLEPEILLAVEVIVE